MSSMCVVASGLSKLQTVQPEVPGGYGCNSSVTAVALGTSAVRDESTVDKSAPIESKKCVGNKQQIKDTRTHPVA